MLHTSSGLLFFGWQLLSKPLRCSIDGPKMYSPPLGRLARCSLHPLAAEAETSTPALPAAGTRATRRTDGSTRQICRSCTPPTPTTMIQRYLLAKAEFLRQQAAYLEESMPKREPIGLQPQESKDPSLDGMTVVVTGANGEVGSVVTEELLRRGCRVRAVVRSAEDQGSYERLSYAVGAESLQGEIEAPWICGTRPRAATVQFGRQFNRKSPRDGVNAMFRAGDVHGAGGR